MIDFTIIHYSTNCIASTAPFYSSSEILHYEGFFDIWTVALSVLTLPIKIIGGNILRLFTRQIAPPYGKKYSLFLLSKLKAINNSREYKLKRSFTLASIFIVRVPIDTFSFISNILSIYKTRVMYFFQYLHK